MGEAVFTFGVEASWVDPSHFKFNLQNLQLINFDKKMPRLPRVVLHLMNDEPPTTALAMPQLTSTQSLNSLNWLHPSANLRGVELSQVAAPSGSVCQLQMWWNDSPVDQDTKRHSFGIFGIFGIRTKTKKISLLNAYTLLQRHFHWFSHFAGIASQNMWVSDEAAIVEYQKGLDFVNSELLKSLPLLLLLCRRQRLLQLRHLQLEWPGLKQIRTSKPLQVLVSFLANAGIHIGKLGYNRSLFHFCSLTLKMLHCSQRV